MLRKTITTLAVAAATLSGVVMAAPAHATVGHCVYGPEGMSLCLTGWTANHRVGITDYSFNLSGPNTDYRVYAGFVGGPSGIRYTYQHDFEAEGIYGPTLCVTEGTTGWNACA